MPCLFLASGKKYGILYMKAFSTEERYSKNTSIFERKIMSRMDRMISGSISRRNTMLKIGAITIGQSPRTDLIPEMEEIFYDDVEIIQMGGLDGLTREEIEKFTI